MKGSFISVYKRNAVGTRISKLESRIANVRDGIQNTGDRRWERGGSAKVNGEDGENQVGESKQKIAKIAKMFF
jgi:hypothetical protein